MNVEQLRKQAKELVRAAHGGDPAPSHGSATCRCSWRARSSCSHASTATRAGRRSSAWTVEQPFHDDIEYYEGRADGIATVNDVTIAEARRDLAGRHGFSSWAALERHVASLASGEEPLPPFVLAYRALEAGDRRRMPALLDAHPELVELRGTNGNDLFGMANDIEITRLLLERGAEVNRGNDYGWTKLHQAGYGNDPALARLLLDAGARTDLYARGDGGTPLIAALFWGHREVVELLGLEPGNLRVAAGLGKEDMIDELVGTPAAGRTAASIGRTEASRRGCPRTTRRRSSTRRSSGRRRPIGSRRSTGWSIAAHAWRPIRTAARRSPGRLRTAASLPFGGWSSWAQT